MKNSGQQSVQGASTRASTRASSELRLPRRESDDNGESPDVNSTDSTARKSVVHSYLRQQQQPRSPATATDGFTMTHNPYSSVKALTLSITSPTSQPATPGQTPYPRLTNRALGLAKNASVATQPLAPGSASNTPAPTLTSFAAAGGGVHRRVGTPPTAADATRMEGSLSSLSHHGSPMLASAPRLLYRWDPYSTPVLDAADSTAATTDGAGAVPDGSLRSRSVSLTFGSRPSRLQEAHASGRGNAPGAPAGPFLSSPLAATASGGSMRTSGGWVAPLTLEELLAESPHLTYASPSSSPGLVPVDKATLSGTSHEHDGRQYFLDYSGTTAAPPQPRGLSVSVGTAPGVGSTAPQAPTQVFVQPRVGSAWPTPAPPQQQQQQQQPVATATTRTYATATRTMAMATAHPPTNTATPTPAVSSVIPALELPAQETPIGAMPQPPDALAPLVDELPAQPSQFLTKMLPPPPPVPLLLAVCSLGSVVSICARYAVLMDSLLGSPCVSALEECPSLEQPTVPPEGAGKGNARHPRGTGSSTQQLLPLANHNPHPAPFYTLERAPRLPDIPAVGPASAAAAAATAEQLPGALCEWYSRAAPWWDRLHKAGGAAAAQAAALVAAARAADQQRSRNGAKASVSPTIFPRCSRLPILEQSRSVQAALAAVRSGAVRRRGQNSSSGGSGSSRPHETTRAYSCQNSAPAPQQPHALQPSGGSGGVAHSRRDLYGPTAATQPTYPYTYL